MRIALYQPDIPQNTGTILRLCACLGIEAHLVGPAGFPASDRAFRRAGMDYLDAVVIVRHRSWRDFESWRSGTEGHRLVLFTTTGAAVRERIGGRATRGPRRCRRSLGHSNAPRPAFAECRGRRGDGRWRGAAANRRYYERGSGPREQRR
jgi:tRNA C32,U32 (ribose-2'-O)-methylase TrmJ